ncbi:MAG: Maf family protein, partial [Clostridiales bacterium]|nr:Maf family protein [Clostridiales bacterium]
KIVKSNYSIKRTIILASASPRREKLLKKIKNDFMVIPSQAENKIKNLNYGNPVETAERLSVLKAQDIYRRVRNCFIRKVTVIAADTVVSLSLDSGRIFGKPRNSEDAFNILKFLSGKEQYIITGVTIIDEIKGILTFHEVTKIKFRELSDAEIQRYVQTGDPLDKAGAYGLQTPGFNFSEYVDGDMDNACGLPVRELAKYLE